MGRKVKILFILLSLTCSVVAQQFDWNDPKINWAWDNNRHTVAITAGLNSFYGFYTPEQVKRGFNNATDIYQALEYSSWNPYGQYGIEYYYNFLKWLRFGGKINLDVSKTNFTDANHSTTYINLMASLQFTYYNEVRWRVYSGIDLGYTSFFDNISKYHANMLGVNITPLGFSYGRAVCIFFELNIGNDAIAKAGISLRL